MPTYAYRCPSCGHEFEKIQKITVKSRARCPKCKTTAERVISGGVGLVFKGSGFYITDYGKKGDKPAQAEKGEKTEKAEKIEKGRDSSGSSGAPPKETS